MISVRDSLERIHWWSQPGRSDISDGFPSGSVTWPPSGSLRSALRATVSPEIGSWETVVDTQITGKWTPGCQGITFHGDNIFVTQNSAKPFAKKGIYKLDYNWEIVDDHTDGHPSRTDFEFEGGDHWGDLDAHDGTIYVALENENRIVEIDPDEMSVLSSTPLRPPASSDADDPSKSYPHTDGSNPWCSINPWNGYLYTSNFGGVRAVYAYDPNDDYRRVPEATISLSRWGWDHPNEPFRGIQGGDFSTNGHLYLSSYTATHDEEPGPHSWEDDPDEYEYLFGFDALAGSFLGLQRLKAKFDKLTGLEMEGLAVESGITYENHGTADVHAVILDRNFPGKNSVQFKAFSLPSGAML